MIDIFQKCSKYFKNFRVKKNLASQTNQQTIHNDVENQTTNLNKEFIIYANTWHYLKGSIRQYFNGCDLF